MSRIRSSGTAPERVVRQILSRSGSKYRMNVRDLPGKPDFANKTRKFAIFVHGCFWHSHENCAGVGSEIEPELLAAETRANQGQGPRECTAPRRSRISGARHLGVLVAEVTGSPGPDS
jgi:hypothetical protein